MADWKKVVVSGSAAHLLNVTASNLTNDNLVIAGVGGALENSGLTYNGTLLNLGSAQVQAAGFSGSFSGSFQGNGAGLTGVVATSGFSLTQGEGISAFSYNGSGVATVAVSGAADLTNNAITKWDNTANKFQNSSLTDNGTAITGTTSIQLTGASSNLSGSFSGSFQGNGAGVTGVSYTTLTNIPANIVSASALSSPAQGEARLTINGVAGSIVDLGLQTTDNPTFAGVTAGNITVGVSTDNTITTTTGGLTLDSTSGTTTINDNVIISGDLTVNGTTTTINTDNLLVEDKFILLASGSTTPTDGGIVIQSAANGTGFAFLYDSAQARWGYTGSLAHNATTAAPDAFAAMVLDLQNGSTDIAAYQKNGNIKIDSGDIWIYS